MTPNSKESNQPTRIIHSSQYIFCKKKTLIFITGAPLSGKSTISSLLSSYIENCSLQSMDILRIIAQEIESKKTNRHKNPFVNYGSCDSYKLIGTGVYSKKTLIEGFNKYSQAVGSILHLIVPKLETQGVENLILEGVQLTPSVVSGFLTNNNKLIILTTNTQQLNSNKKKLFIHDTTLMKRYSNERLVLLQQEILHQSLLLPKEKYFVIDNTSPPKDVCTSILKLLIDSKIIKRN